MNLLRTLYALGLLLALLHAVAQATGQAPLTEQTSQAQGQAMPHQTPLQATPVANERITYIHADALGSPVLGTDPQGDVVWREDYQPYGERFLGDAANTRRIYTGKYEETSTGLVDFGGRWYNPEIGRFYSVDPHSFNRYAYANDNPYAFVDPDGEAPQDVVKLVPAFGASLGGLAAYTQGQLTGDATLVDTSLAGMNTLMGSNIEALASLVTPPGTARVIIHAAEVAKGIKTADLGYDANKVSHIFADKHQLDPLVKKFGSQDAALSEMHRTAQSLTTNPGAYQTGSWVSIKVGDIPVSVKGAIIDGQFRISTATMKPFQ